jgi:hypothetical protein
MVGHAEDTLRTAYFVAFRAQNVKRKKRALAAQQPVDKEQSLSAFVGNDGVLVPDFLE